MLDVRSSLNRTISMVADLLTVYLPAALAVGLALTSSRARTIRP